MVRSAIAELVGGRTLSVAEAESVMTAMMSGEATPAQIAAILAMLRHRGETVAEVTGFAQAMRAHATPVHTSRSPVIDTCGTGGGGHNTFNVSTAAAVVAAAAGVTVAKHGNHAMTSQCGSADVLAALGVAIDLPADAAGRCLDDIGIAFLYAPALHPAMKHASGPRRELGVRTVFNLLGPLTNPAGATAQVIGVPEPHLVDLLIDVMAGLGRARAMVVHALAGFDEIGITGPTRIAELRDGWVRKYSVTPEELGIDSAPVSSVAGGDAVTNAATITAIYEGEAGPPRDFVVLNAAAALVVGGIADDLTEGIGIAERVLDSGAARDKLAAWREWAA